MQRIAQRHGLAVTAVSAFGSSLEAAAAVHLAATAPNASLGAELCLGLLATDPAEPPFPVAPVDVPTEPGLSVSLPDGLFA